MQTLPDTGLNLCFDELTFSVVKKSPRMLVFGQRTLSYGPYVGFDAEMRVYVAQRMNTDNTDDLCWMANGNWLILGSDQRVTIDFFLKFKYGDDRNDIPAGQTGRFEDDHGICTCARDATFGCLDDFPMNKMKFTPGVELLINNKEGYFDGHALQIWSDGVITRKGSYHVEEPKFQPSKDVLTLLKYALRQKYWQKNDRWMKLLNLQVITKEEFEKKEFGHSGNYYGFALFKWNTTIGPMWLVESSWSYLGEDGDGGENTLVFDHEAEARVNFKREVSGFEERERKITESYLKEERDEYL